MPIVMIPAPQEGSARSWAKVVRWVNLARDTGYAFEGDWLRRGQVAEVEEGDLILLCDDRSRRGLAPYIRTFIVSQGQLVPAHDEHGPLEAKGRDWALQLRDRIATLFQRQDQPYAGLTSEELARELARHPYGGRAYGQVAAAAASAGELPFEALAHICAEILKADMLSDPRRQESPSSSEEEEAQMVTVEIPPLEEGSCDGWAMVVTQVDRGRDDAAAFQGVWLRRGSAAVVKEGSVILLYDRSAVSESKNRWHRHARVFLVSRGELVPAHDGCGPLEAKGQNWARQLCLRVAVLLERRSPQPAIPLGSLVRELVRRRGGGLAYVAALREARAAGCPHASRCGLGLYTEIVLAHPLIRSIARRLVKSERAAESSGHDA